MAEIYQFNGSWYAAALQVVDTVVQAPDMDQIQVTAGKLIGGPWGMRESAEHAAEEWYHQTQETPPMLLAG